MEWGNDFDAFIFALTQKQGWFQKSEYSIAFVLSRLFSSNMCLITRDPYSQAWMLFCVKEQLLQRWFQEWVSNCFYVLVTLFSNMNLIQEPIVAYRQEERYFETKTGEGKGQVIAGANEETTTGGSKSKASDGKDDCKEQWLCIVAYESPVDELVNL